MVKNNIENVLVFLKNVYWIIKFSGFLATKFESLNNGQCKTRPALIDLNPVEHNNYPFMITLLCQIVERGHIKYTRGEITKIS